MSDPVWREVTPSASAPNRVTCKHCGKELNRNPTYLKQHIISANCDAPDEVRRDLAARLVAGRHRKARPQLHRDRAMEAAQRALVPEPHRQQHSTTFHLPSQHEHTIRPRQLQKPQVGSPPSTPSHQSSPSRQQREMQGQSHSHKRLHHEKRRATPISPSHDPAEGDTRAVTTRHNLSRAAASLTVRDVGRAMRQYVCSGLDDRQQRHTIGALVESGVQSFMLSGIVLVSDAADPQYLAENILRRRSLQPGAVKRDGIYLAVLAFVHDARRGQLDLTHLLGHPSERATLSQGQQESNSDSSSENGDAPVDKDIIEPVSASIGRPDSREKEIGGDGDNGAGRIQREREGKRTSIVDDDDNDDDNGVDKRKHDDIDDGKDEDDDEDEDEEAGVEPEAAAVRTASSQSTLAKKHKQVATISADQQLTSDDENSN